MILSKNHFKLFGQSTLVLLTFFLTLFFILFLCGLLYFAIISLVSDNDFLPDPDEKEKSINIKIDGTDMKMVHMNDV
ncbi:hypothetical protein WAK64_06910 [Bacillus spongiae]|uniref:Uncharacterized protein n=1 Tax=Bacillus spongiae TaxID=2683610 RepID=A0ABU8HC21_9BACI